MRAAPLITRAAATTSIPETPEKPPMLLGEEADPDAFPVPAAEDPDGFPVVPAEEPEPEPEPEPVPVTVVFGLEEPKLEEPELEGDTVETVTPAFLHVVANADSAAL